MATPVKFSASRWTTILVVQLAPPSRPSECPLTVPPKNPLKRTRPPTTGFCMKYTFQMKQQSSVPNVSNTVTPYGPSTLPCVSARAENRARSHLLTPEAPHVRVLLLAIAAPALLSPYLSV